MKIEYTACKAGKENRSILLLNGKIVEEERWQGFGLILGEAAYFALGWTLEPRGRARERTREILEELRSCRGISGERVEEIIRRVSRDGQENFILLVIKDDKFRVYRAGDGFLYRKWGRKLLPLISSGEASIFPCHRLGQGMIQAVELTLVDGEVLIMTSPPVEKDEVLYPELLASENSPGETSFIKVEVKMSG